ncbi:protein-disulfide reductase DsbD [Luteimonas soli]|uniref:Thiol:disulfide interchange protein DsbD n=1 Tax=Luteimonas soli TaxID=1648966 RepID=A0ABV7XKP1_9GAMM
MSKPFFPRWPRIAAALALCLACVSPALAAIYEDDLLPVDQAFVLTAKATSADRIALEWKIADGYYLYRHRTKAVAGDGSRLGELDLPRGEPHEDEFFGHVETFRQRLAGSVPVQAADGGKVTLKVSYQGCADIGVCYPPQTRTLAVAMPAGAAGAGAAATGDAGFAALGQSLGQPRGTGLAGAAAGRDAQPLPPEQAFGFDAIADGGNALLLRFTPAPGYYLYRDNTTLQLAADGITLDKPRWPQGTSYHDEHFGDVVVYFDQVEVPVPLRRTKTQPQKVTLTATFQGCQDEGICYPPMTRTARIALPAGDATVAAADGKPIPTPARPALGHSPRALDQARTSGPQTPALAPLKGRELDPVGSDAAVTAAPDLKPSPSRGGLGGDGFPADNDATPGANATDQKIAAEAAPTGIANPDAELAEDTRLAAALTGSGRWLTLLWFFLGGLGLAFTPCVLPMIPILSGLIAGAGTRIGTRRALWLSFVYVLANALVFTVAGIVAGLVGANLQVAFQVPWVIALFALLFVALALSSFGLYELQLPAALRSKLGRVSDRQRGGSLAGVAAMGALSALIVGPCVAPPLAAAVLYIGQSQDPAFGGLALFLLAMGMGLPLLAFGAAAGRGMPTSGPWMTGVQRAFGFVFLALAVWMLSRIVPGPLTLALYGVLALAAAAWAWGGARSDSARLRWFARFAGLLLAVVGTAELFGALAGSRNPLQPLAGFGGGQAQAELAFRMIKSSEDLDRELAAAQAAGKPLLFDFYADWCVSCKEMEAYTFTDPAVQAALADFVLLKADVTANDEVDQALMQRFGIIGPPATLFFNGSADERRGLRLVGFEKAAPFAERVQRAAAGAP